MPGTATRISDAERERAVADLRRHYAEGRLDTPELERRATAAYSADRREELSGLFADLPTLWRAHLSPGALTRRARRTHRMLLRGHLATYLGVNGFLIAVWLLTGRGVFWPALYLVPSTALLVWHWMGGRMLARALSRPPAITPWMAVLARVVMLGRRVRR